MKKEASSGGGWGATKSPTRSDAGGGWGATKSPVHTGGSAWGNTAKEPPKCPVLKSPDKSDNAGWGSNNQSQSKGGWGDSPEIKSGGGGWGDSPEENKESGSGWGVSEKKEPTIQSSGWGGSNDTGASKNSWDSVVKPPELQDGWGKETNNKSTSNNSGWGEKTNASPIKVSGGDGWGTASPAKTPTPPKPCLVNKPPLEAAVDTKNDPRVKPKRRISMADYKKRKEDNVSVSSEMETAKDDKVVDDVESTKELEAELLEKNEDQALSGSSSPTSPAFEVETVPATQPVDPKEVLTELAAELGNDSDAKFSSDEEEL